MPTSLGGPDKLIRYRLPKRASLWTIIKIRIPKYSYNSFSKQIELTLIKQYLSLTQNNIVANLKISNSSGREKNTKCFIVDH